MTALSILEAHPFADIFPAMLEDEKSAFIADIHQHGVQIPITLYQGKILDGRHRYDACQVLYDTRGLVIKPQFTLFQGTDEEALQFVYSMNAQRRHLNMGQRAYLAVELKKELQKLAQHGNPNRAEDGTFTIVCNNTDNGETHESAQIAAQVMNVKAHAVYAAERLMEEAPDLAERVRAGEMPLYAAVNATAIRNGTQTRAQAVKAVADEIVAAIGFENVTEETVERLAQVMEEEQVADKVKAKTAHVSHNSGENEWYTPPEFIEAARRAMGNIDLDPASTPLANERVKAEKFFTVDDDGLTQNWEANGVWMNPPYKQPAIEEFAFAAEAKFRMGEFQQACILVNNATETAWFQRLLSATSALCFVRGRVRFLDPQGNPGAPLQGQIVLYLGDCPERFVQAFEGLGIAGLW